MPRLPVVSGLEAVRAFEIIGYRVVRRKGSHIRLRDDTNELHRPLTIPDHKELTIGVLRRLISDANLTVDEFVELLKS